jgi:hypothetical protein
MFFCVCEILSTKLDFFSIVLVYANFLMFLTMYENVLRIRTIFCSDPDFSKTSESGYSFARFFYVKYFLQSLTTTVLYTTFLSF